MSRLRIITIVRGITSCRYMSSTRTEFSSNPFAGASPIKQPVVFHIKLADCNEILEAQRFMAKMVVTHGPSSEEAVAAAGVIAKQSVLRERLLGEIHAGGRIYDEIISAVPSATLVDECRRIIPPPEPQSNEGIFMKILAGAICLGSFSGLIGMVVSTF